MHIFELKQEILYIVTNLMYTPRSSCVIFLTISQDLPFRSFPLYRRSASDPPLWNKFRISVIIDLSPRAKYGLYTYIQWIG